MRIAGCVAVRLVAVGQPAFVLEQQQHLSLHRYHAITSQIDAGPPLESPSSSATNSSGCCLNSSYTSALNGSKLSRKCSMSVTSNRGSCLQTTSKTKGENGVDLSATGGSRERHAPSPNQPHGMSAGCLTRQLGGRGGCLGPLQLPLQNVGAISGHHGVGSSPQPGNELDTGSACKARGHTRVLTLWAAATGDRHQTPRDGNDSTNNQ